MPITRTGLADCADSLGNFGLGHRHADRVDGAVSNFRRKTTHVLLYGQKLVGNELPVALLC